MSVCTDCARGPRKGCCWADPVTRYEESFGISISDVRRIAKASGLKPSEFLKAEEVTPELREAVSMGYLDLFRVMKGNLRLSLLSDQDGTCVLMGPQGCTLSRENRPRVCATYPSHYEVVRDRVVVKSDALSDRTACLALERSAGSPHKLYRILKSSEASTRKLAEKARYEAEAHDLMSVKQIRDELEDMEWNR